MPDLSTNINRTPTSCLSCRVTGSVTLLGLAWVLSSSRSTATSPAHRLVLTVGSLGLCGLAVARGGDWYPFGENK